MTIRMLVGGITRVVLSAIALSCALPVSAQGRTPWSGIIVHGVHPAAPRPFETVNLRLSANICDGVPGNLPVELAGGEIRVTVHAGVPQVCTATQPYLIFRDYEVRLGSFPVGSYLLNVVTGNDYSGRPLPETTLLRTTFQVVAPPEVTVYPPVPRPLTDFSGVWWSAPQSGWGVTIAQSITNQMLVALYVYDAAGGPEWFVAPAGTWSTPWRWSGALYRASGPTFGSFSDGSFDSAAVVRTPVGTAALDFAPGLSNGVIPVFGEADFTYSINGNSGTRRIRRFDF